MHRRCASARQTPALDIEHRKHGPCMAQGAIGVDAQLAESFTDLFVSSFRGVLVDVAVMPEVLRGGPALVQAR